MPTSYITNLGDDNRSAWMLGEWRKEGINTDHVACLKSRQPGLYWIATDENGERTFAYWRSEAPARNLFDDAARVVAIRKALANFGVVYLSGITLSLFEGRALERFTSLLDSLRSQGITVVFDGNYRPAGWSSKAAAQLAFEQTCRIAQIALPTFDDEVQLFADQTPEETCERLLSWGIEEVVVKLGPGGCLIASNAGLQLVETTPVTMPVDTTAAGDAFNAGYLAARYKGKPPVEAAKDAHRLATVVIKHRGAIIPRDSMPPL